MSPEERVLIERVLEVTEQNNKMLKLLYRASVMGRIIKTIYWFVIIALTVGSYYVLQPYLDLLKTSYSNLTEQAGNISETLQSVGKLQKDAEDMLR